jgi:hypothetical protein
MDKKSYIDEKVCAWRDQLAKRMCKLKQGEFGNL